MSDDVVPPRRWSVMDGDTEVGVVEGPESPEDALRAFADERGLSMTYMLSRGFKAVLAGARCGRRYMTFRWEATVPAPSYPPDSRPDDLTVDKARGWAWGQLARDEGVLVMKPE